MNVDATGSWLEEALADSAALRTGPRELAKWPQAAEYNDAVSAEAWSDDPLLVGLTPEYGGLYDRPIMLCGANAAVFRLQAADGGVSAMRCFFSPPTNAARRAAHLVEHVPAHLTEFIVPTVWVDNGLWVGNEWVPVQLSPWVDGLPLDQWIEDHLHDSERIVTLADQTAHSVVAMQEAGLAHGDLQHGNILVTEGDLPVLVDLDSFVVFDPLTAEPIDGWPLPAELGQPAYQHVQRMRLAEWASGVDVFSCLVIDASLRLLAAEPEMWASHNNGDNLIIGRADLEDPFSSKLIQHMVDHSDARIAARGRQIRAASEQPMSALAPARRWLIDFEIVDDGERWELDWYQGGTSAGPVKFGLDG